MAHVEGSFSRRDFYNNDFSGRDVNSRDFVCNTGCLQCRLFAMLIVCNRLLFIASGLLYLEQDVSGDVRGMDFVRRAV
jgi:hypothetical protein